MLNATTWFERYQQRYRWAVRAYDRFVQDLAPELVDNLQRNEQVTVAVYGATQVGKTTLILDLLGLSTLTTDEVGSVLRGGQELGKSATAMPIRYGRSQDDSWYIAGEGPLSADMAREKLGDFRRKVEAGAICDAEVLDIRIPHRFFQACDDSNAGLELNIIDIPGINSHSSDEREHVTKLADRYVAVADLVLLVGKADSLGFLNERDLIIPALADWAAQPTRFRIVLTYGFSPQSLINQLQDQGLTVEQVRDVHIGQMRTHDYDFPPEFRANLFVLELGDSVVDLGRTNPEYRQRILQVTKAFRDELLEGIAKAAGPYARLQGAFQLDRVINARVERLRRAMKKQDATFEDQRKQLMRELASFRPDLLDASDEGIFRAIEELEIALLELRQKLGDLSVSMKCLENFNYADFFSVKLSSGAVEKVSWLKEQLESCENLQRKACGEVAGRLVKAGVLLEWLKDYVPTIEYQRTCLMEIDSHLDSYVLDGYWWSSSNFNEDCASLQMALRLNAKDHGERLKAATNRALQERKRALQADEKSLQSRRTVLRSYLERLQGFERENQQICATHMGDLQEMEGALGMASRFESQLNTAFMEELRRTQEDVQSHAIPAQRFYGLLHTRLLLSEIDRMYEGKSF
ncbi:hypothetical protein FQZ97_296600 [compost metagenome]